MIAEERAFGAGAIADMVALVAAGREGESDRHEPNVPAFVADVRGARLFVDCGAEYGFYTRLALREGAPDLRVVAFEPEHLRATALRASLGADPRVEVREQAVADAAGPRAALKPGPGVSLSFAGAFHMAGTPIQVEAVTLDVALAGEEPDLLKMDIEGAETLAFDGMRDLLARCRRLTCYVEFHAPPHAAEVVRRRALIGTLSRAGYPLTSTDEARVIFGGHVILRRPR